jgi:glycosyltransferase involved in cell wall biosynthesis
MSEVSALSSRTTATEALPGVAEFQALVSRISQRQVSHPELTVLLPCLNEKETLAKCIAKAQAAIQKHQLDAEVIVSDNGSTDGSQEIAERAGARVIHVPQRGYGAALIAGVAAARGTYIIMADSDDSYDLSSLMDYLAKLKEGYDLVIGNRFKGEIAAGAMPFLHRYLGTPVLTFLAHIFFHTPCGDVNCGMRGFRREAALRLDLRSPGMEFASEMLVKSSLFGLRMAEVPTALARDGRSTKPHLRTWHDGWRHLRFLLMYSPRWLFLYPGLALMTVGITGSIWLLPKPARFHNFGLDIHTLLYAFVAILLGFDLVGFAALTKVFAISEGLLPEDPRMTAAVRRITLEVGLSIGTLLVILGLAGSALAVSDWGAQNFGALDPSHMFRIVLPSAFSLMLGVEIIFGSFFLCILGLKRRL